MVNLQFKTQLLAGKKILSLELAQNQELDYIALKTLINDPPQQVVQVACLAVNNTNILRYECDNILDFKYLPRNLAFHQYLQMLDNLVTFLLGCSDWFLNHRSFILDCSNLFFDKEDFTIKLIYLPIVGLFSSDEQIKHFFKHLATDYQVEQGGQLLYELLKALTEPGFTLMDIKLIIDKHKQQQQQVLITAASDSAEINQENHQPINQSDQQSDSSSKVTDLVQLESDHEDVYQTLKDYPTADSSPTGKTIWSIFKRRKASNSKITEKLNQQELKQVNLKRETDNLPDKYDLIALNHTELLTGNNLTEYFFKLEYNLVYNNLPAEIPIDLLEGFFTIGRQGYQQTNSSFLFDSTVKSVSRIHARIEQDDEKLSIVDLHSANGTYLNGLKLTPNVPARLNLGDQIKFSASITYSLCIRE